ncbi:MAG: hypothetical protein CSA11_10245 [Chloroflexi bacterium]|nr:MAG: hypothetical protein CSA11_10245 [Chloroflexota bacterium]
MAESRANFAIQMDILDHGRLGLNPGLKYDACKMTMSKQKKRAVLIPNSPLRQIDPRTKLFLSLLLSFTIMLPLSKLLFCLGLFGLLLWWAKLLPATLYQLWRLRFVLLFLFIVDWLLVDLTLAITICLRLILLASTFSLLVCTTTPMEMRLALEWLRLPYRYAFSLSLAFQSIDLLTDEWRGIQEAQVARGITLPTWAGWRKLPDQAEQLLALTVPAIILTTKRAWTMTEAAYARGFDAPQRTAYRQLTFTWRDGVLLLLILAVVAVLLVWPFT